MYHKILVALDVSPVDEAILSHITELAKVHHSEIILLRVAHYHTRDAKRHETEEAETYLAQVAERLQAQGLAVQTLVGHGEPAKVILEQAEALGCDLIAMSTHGHRMVYDLIFGSVAEVVRHRATIPVLLLRG